MENTGYTILYGTKNNPKITKAHLINIKPMYNQYTDHNTNLIKLEEKVSRYRLKCHKDKIFDTEISLFHPIITKPYTEKKVTDLAEAYLRPISTIRNEINAYAQHINYTNKTLVTALCGLKKFNQNNTKWRNEIIKEEIAKDFFTGTRRN